MYVDPNINFTYIYSINSWIAPFPDCPASCTSPKNGVCMNGVCECNDGLMDIDCSVNGL
jgi:hypothetical protein